MKVFVTKYALTQGIFEAEGELDGRYVYLGGAGTIRIQCRLDRDCFENKRDAEEWAKTLAAREVKHLRLRLAKLEQLAEVPKWRKVRK